MPIRFESFIKEGDKNEKNIAKDIINTCNSWGIASFRSKAPKYFMFEYPLTDEYTKQEFGLITNLIKIEDSKFKLRDCHLTINAEPKKIHLYKHLPDADEETHDYYLAKEDSLFPTPSFVVELVNRQAIWDEKLENKNVYAGLSAFAYQIEIFDDLDEYNKRFNSTEETPNLNFDYNLAAAIDAEGEDPCTFFQGEILDVQDVKAKLKENEIGFSIITIDCFLGPLKLVASRDVFNLSKLEKGKLLVTVATIKANLGIDPTPGAIVGSETETPQDNKIVDNAVTRLADASFDISSELKNKIKRVTKKVVKFKKKSPDK